jgi:nitrite reductase/ring-hydroxylating ferredoxin subunit/DMSO/TMAO reductase YedYZ heme-binding membrane subunit
VSARYLPVGWTRTKLAYDAVLVAAIALYILAYTRLAPMLGDPGRSLDEPTLLMRAQGSCAFLLLTAALAIGPLARLDRRFLPLLYNRRHLGVLTCVVAVSHVISVLDWHFNYSPTPALVAMLSSEHAGTIPFIGFGIAALFILVLLAVTSHDFWLAFLSPRVWKALHMSIYGAYALLVAHVAFGHLQSAVHPAFTLLVAGCTAGLLALHLLAAFRARADDAAEAFPAADGWLRAGPLAAIAEDRALVVRPPDGEPVAIFRHNGSLSALSHLCAHQNGPLGEGRVLDGCVTCPWHGFQYRLEDGCAPPPYTEKLATYRLRLEGGDVLVDPRPLPPGTRVEPLVLPA